MKVEGSGSTLVVLEGKSSDWIRPGLMSKCLLYVLYRGGGFDDDDDSYGEEEEEEDEYYEETE